MRNSGRFRRVGLIRLTQRCLIPSVTRETLRLETSVRRNGVSTFSTTYPRTVAGRPIISCIADLAAEAHIGGHHALQPSETRRPHVKSQVGRERPAPFGAERLDREPRRAAAERLAQHLLRSPSTIRSTMSAGTPCAASRLRSMSLSIAAKGRRTKPWRSTKWRATVLLPAPARPDRPMTIGKLTASLVSELPAIPVDSASRSAPRDSLS